MTNVKKRKLNLERRALQRSRRRELGDAALSHGVR